MAAEAAREQGGAGSAWSSESHVDEGWLGGLTETVLDPDLPIVDPHHHLWDHSHHRYLRPELLRDLGSGHAVRATVYVEASSCYSTEGPDEFRPIGETRFVGGVAEASAQAGPGAPQACAAIVAFARLQLGEQVAGVIEAHIEAGGGRVRGIRNVSTWDSTPALQSRRSNPPPGLLLDSRFRQGFAALDRFGLAFDAWLYHTQLGELADLADGFPDTSIVIDHLGGPIGVAQYAGRRTEVFSAWSERMRELARRPKLFVKIGGLGMPWAGFGLRERPIPATSEELAALWAPYIETAITLFGPERCMFESNFPVDNEVCTYRTLWNAFKRVTSAYSADERQALFAGTASEVYRLDGALNRPSPPGR